MVILSETGHLDALLALGHDGVGQVRVTVAPQGMGQEPIGVDPRGPSPDESPGIAGMNLGSEAGTEGSG